MLGCFFFLMDHSLMQLEHGVQKVNKLSMGNSETFKRTGFES